ncbi:putative disease resistance protein RGA4 isoform X1 [Malus domestica]|uniref:putative disease resistance protein RGA4 isoform X1 n=1 Tax=Malus domestica TaxID=3750 RepID=UPI0010AA6917|nr:putative disease resistance protein RGA3 isoform X1 [Malus domestica]XP_028943922.1 putative disease resistance protein RGA3 isoform X1 [Malus domestica]XP_028943923.1 putative disease resistance protein RGA3 isoform X1 [Malus domestica]XP_028943924.1 putative disease resistance protein RGA3 isoform X1 [Malus domestica]XP_028943925.1 putative disease resistance protein RGA3 isoform X1 [Malus domestica]XP_028943926.1 putative disease resistance protein RGA3 isoform X1 [Malus domestica]XP_02
MAAEAVLTFAAEGILEKVLSLAEKEFSLAWGFKAELRKLKESFTTIELLLNDVAYKPQAPAIEEWVKKLKGVAEDAEDVLDEFKYEVDRRKVEIQNHMKRKVLNFFSLSNPLAFRLQMAHKIQKINASLVDLERKASPLGLVSRNTDATRQGITWDRRTDSLIGKDEITVGRKDDVSNIVKTLTDSKSNQENLAVMAIVGMGGLGKTTLAKSVYNENSIQKFFDKRIWICVSNPFDVNLILLHMLEHLNPAKAPSKDNKNALLEFLNEELKDKRYLLVLDDVWNEDLKIWDNLMECLSKLNSTGGSKIIVTTRSGKVASILKKLLLQYELGELSVDECWSIMKDKAFPINGVPEFNSNASTFETIGKEIAKNCGGVPLVAKVLGGILRTKKSIEEWSSFKNSRIWNNHSKEEDRIMSILRLSFDNLESPSLKQCFAYCSMFEKDAEIQRDNLIQLWMAQGLLRSWPNGIKDMEDIGNEYFDILLQSSLFQDATMSDNGIVSECKMHDLVHDLAEHLFKSEGLTGDLCGIDNTLEIRHVARVSTSTLEKFPERSAGKLRSLFSDDGEVTTNILPRFKALRVLNLSEANIEELPDSIGRLKHLRYLDISKTRFKALPKSIGKLYNLQTLRGTQCALKEFPKELLNLINLRHIYFYASTKFPQGIGRLTYLRTLCYFSVGNEIGRRIEELAGLNQLRGELIICDLEHVENGEEAEKAKLEEKTKVRHLHFNWTKDRSTTDNNEEEGVLEGLRPHLELESLSIENFMGNKFPPWMMSGSLLNNLKKIKLLGCHKCEGVPPLSLWASLQNLSIENCNGLSGPLSLGASLVEVILRNCNGLSGSLSLGASLVELTIEGCNNLTSIEMKGSGSLTASLQKLRIWFCNELSSIPALPQQCPSLQKLSILGCPKLSWFGVKSSRVEKEEKCISLQSTSDLRTMTSLRRMWIERCERLESWVSSLQFPLSLEYLIIVKIPNLEILPSLDHLNSLRYLEIGGFWEELDSFPDFEVGSLMHLTSLQLNGWPKLKSLPQQIQHLTSLTDLWIVNFEGVETLPEWLGSLTSLTYLRIQGCKNLMNLPSVQAMQRLTKLQTLRIYNCHPLLNERCRRDSGTDWPKISHIPYFRIRGRDL